MPFDPAVLAVAVAVIVLADRRLKAVAQPLRLRLAEKGEEFLQRRDVPDQAREYVRFLVSIPRQSRGL